MDKDQFYANARHDLAGPLDGIRVADVTTTWAGPMCSCVLADLGADVIKVEHPDGDVARRLPPMLPTGESFAHALVNRNKRCLSLDLHSEAILRHYIDARAPELPSPERRGGDGGDAI